MTIELSLAVQYAEAAPELPRWRLRRWVQRCVDAAGTEIPGLRAANITLRLVGLDEGQELNRQFRERDYATNVLTFEYGLDPDGVMTSDIVLCLPVLRREADEQGKSIQQHAAHLTVHGVLHSLGHDHLDDAQAKIMENIEARVLAALGFADPYA